MQVWRTLILCTLSSQGQKKGIFACSTYRDWVIPGFDRWQWVNECNGDLTPTEFDDTLGRVARSVIFMI
jgi:hypothetical protein